jgi:sodium/potassium-transporting ATPase subunit alpha
MNGKIQALPVTSVFAELQTSETASPGITAEPRLLWRAYLFLGLIESAAAMTCYFFVLYSGGWHWGAVPPEALYRQATTACLTAIIVAQVANVLFCRSPIESALPFRFRTNSLLLPAIAFEIGLQLAIVYSSPGHRVFATAPLSLNVWAVAVPFAVALFVAEEIRKAYFVRRRLGHGADILSGSGIRLEEQGSTWRK